MAHRILFLDQFGYLGGAQRVLWETLRSLDATEYDFCMAINGPGEFRDTLVKEKIPVLNLPLGNYHSARKTMPDAARFAVRTLLCTLHLLRQGRKTQWDLLWANGPRTFIAAVLAGFATGTPVGWHVHNILTSRTEILLLLIFSRWVKRIIVCSGAAASPLLARRRQLESKIRILYNPHPDWDWAPPVRQASLLRRKFEMADKDYLFGILGRVTPFKGQKDFLFAAARVIKHFPETRFFVIGSPASGDPIDLGYQAQLRQLVDNANLESSVFFIPHQSSVREYIEGLDAAVMASSGPEALPQSLIEAMFLAKPVIAPAQGGIPEMINQGVTGLLYPAGDTEALAGRMLDLLRCRQWGAQIGLQAREYTLKQFSRARFQCGIREEISSCLGEA